MDTFDQFDINLGDNITFITQEEFKHNYTKAEYMADFDKVAGRTLTVTEIITYYDICHYFVEGYPETAFIDADIALVNGDTPKLISRKSEYKKEVICQN